MKQHRGLARRTTMGAAIACTAMGCAGSDAGQGSGSQFQDSSGVILVSNSSSGAWTADEVWSVEPDWVIGDVEGDANTGFGEITGLDVGEDGEVVVFDRLSSEIRVFDDRGAFLARIGRAGQGPGEFGLAVLGVLLRGDTIYVPDPLNRSIHRFLLGGEALQGLPYPTDPAPRVAWSIAPGHLISHLLMPDYEALLAYDLSSQIEDTLVVLQPTNVVQSVGDLGRGGKITVNPLPDQPVWVVLQDGRVVVGHTSSNRITIHGPDGSLERIVSGPFQRRALDQQEQDAILELEQERALLRTGSAEAAEQLAQMVDYVLPDSLLLFTTFVGTSRGELLVQRPAPIEEMDPAGLQAISREGLGGSTWDVFDAVGRYLGAVSLPENLRLAKAWGDYIYGVIPDELDRDRVVRLRVERERLQ